MTSMGKAGLAHDRNDEEVGGRLCKGGEGSPQQERPGPAASAPARPTRGAQPAGLTGRPASPARRPRARRGGRGGRGSPTAVAPAPPQAPPPAPALTAANAAAAAATSDGRAGARARARLTHGREVGGDGGGLHLPAPARARRRPSGPRGPSPPRPWGRPRGPSRTFHGPRRRGFRAAPHASGSPSGRRRTAGFGASRGRVREPLPPGSLCDARRVPGSRRRGPRGERLHRGGRCGCACAFVCDLGPSQPSARHGEPKFLRVTPAPCWFRPRHTEQKNLPRPRVRAAAEVALRREGRPGKHRQMQARNRQDPNLLLGCASGSRLGWVLCCPAVGKASEPRRRAGSRRRGAAGRSLPPGGCTGPDSASPSRPIRTGSHLPRRLGGRQAALAPLAQVPPDLSVPRTPARTQIRERRVRPLQAALEIEGPGPEAAAAGRCPPSSPETVPAPRMEVASLKEAFKCRSCLLKPTVKSQRCRRGQDWNLNDLDTVTPQATTEKPSQPRGAQETGGLDIPGAPKNVRGAQGDLSVGVRSSRLRTASGHRVCEDRAPGRLRSGWAQLSDPGTGQASAWLFRGRAPRGRVTTHDGTRHEGISPRISSAGWAPVPSSRGQDPARRPSSPPGPPAAAPGLASWGQGLSVPPALAHTWACSLGLRSADGSRATPHTDCVPEGPSLERLQVQSLAGRPGQRKELWPPGCQASLEAGGDGPAPPGRCARRGFYPEDHRLWSEMCKPQPESRSPVVRSSPRPPPKPTLPPAPVTAGHRLHGPHRWGRREPPRPPGERTGHRSGCFWAGVWPAPTVLPEGRRGCSPSTTPPPLRSLKRPDHKGPTVTAIGRELSPCLVQRVERKVSPIVSPKGHTEQQQRQPAGRGPRPPFSTTAAGRAENAGRQPALCARRLAAPQAAAFAAVSVRFRGTQSPGRGVQRPLIAPPFLVHPPPPPERGPAGHVRVRR
ncbi:collagen alpha-1(I) chain-like [Hippopotamus amphibius kiboko]|uniref:collagen alpha-1(I) chain-like n=1 Tax=Hippopotamus amphibius kiboko TaxID=575201 RepID=UPI002597623B|nr:collagen alpha-1(I) chain-like [Hippopotamus amphibius kiboko]